MSVVGPSGEQFELAFGDQRAVVTEVGGGLRAYSVGDRQLVDGYGADQMCPSGRGQPRTAAGRSVCPLDRVVTLAIRAGGDSMSDARRRRAL